MGFLKRLFGGGSSEPDGPTDTDRADAADIDADERAR